MKSLENGLECFLKCGGRMAVLIDKIIKEKRINNKTVEINKEHFIAKPMPYYSWKIWKRIKDAYLVLTNKAFAVQYAKDYFK